MESKLSMPFGISGAEDQRVALRHLTKLAASAHRWEDMGRLCREFVLYTNNSLDLEIQIVGNDRLYRFLNLYYEYSKIACWGNHDPPEFLIPS